MYDLRRKPYTNYTQNPTPQPYILLFEHESNGWNGSNGWSEWNEWIVRNASNVRNERNERDERNERNERNGLVTASPRRHRGDTGAEFHHFI